MASEKPTRDDRKSVSRPKKHSKGISVGPEHLPDGTYRRKVEKIKRNLIHRASVKRSYAKLKSREAREQDGQPTEGDAPAARAAVEPASLEPHPARQAMMQQPVETMHDAPVEGGRPWRRPKPNPFQRESLAAQRAKEKAAEKTRAMAAAQEQRATRQEQRERWRREMAKARGYGKGGKAQRKLGRESKVLLEKVQRMLEKEKEDS